MSHTNQATEHVVEGLALALVNASTVPVLLLDAKLTVLAASTSFCNAFQIDPQNIPDHELLEIGRGEWDTPALRSLLRATSAGYSKIDAYEMDLKRRDRATRRLALQAVKLDYGNEKEIRLLLTVSDITDLLAAEKLRESLAHEKVLLLREVQHRVANSLQIIASVLLQSARQVASEETRSHLNDAHNRVLSVAAVQKQLAGSGSEMVEMRPYVRHLCDSLAGSMIRDHDQIAIHVDVDDSSRDADDSMALGLIVTELVINAIKHAFDERRKGLINVRYLSRGDDWSLQISDNGVGSRAGRANPGLGTSIVEALSRQLRAKHSISATSAGTVVSIDHKAVPGAGTAAPQRP